MSLKTLGKFEVKRLEILSESGKADSKLMPKLSNEQIKSMYEFMVLTRAFDNKCVNLQRQGRMGTYAQMLGQEATIIGSAFALDKKTDWVVPSFRESGVYIYLNYPIEMLMQYWGGHETGMKIPEEINILPVAVPVGTQTLHGVGIAYALKYKKQKGAVAIYFGDGATSEGDFHEAMNFAGVFKLPAVFICQNNQWAISVPRSKQTASITLAQKAIAYGFDNYIQVDGNDIFAVYKVVKEALDNAKKGKGPSFIECETYRMSNHTTADDHTKYRSEKEVKAWEKKDPILRLKIYMKSKKLWNENYEKKVTDEANAKIENAVKKYESTPPQNPEGIFSYMYAELTPELKEQQREFKQTLQDLKQFGQGEKGE
ncbi:MAG: pyruvate dehydrogenase (acetyl-transferring) E1 component subunit alpha [Nanoarchaeota archaeon]